MLGFSRKPTTFCNPLMHLMHCWAKVRVDGHWPLLMKMIELTYKWNNRAMISWLRKQITFSKRNFTFSFWGICFSNSILGAACDRSYVKNCVSHYHTPAFQAKTSEILMIFWVTLISPPVRVLNVEQSESLRAARLSLQPLDFFIPTSKVPARYC